MTRRSSIVEICKLGIFLFVVVILLAGSSLPIHHSISILEDCSNAIDDDNDGLIDINDPDCECEKASPNRIPNPSFEYFNSCPYSNSQLDFATPWVQPFPRSSDFYHECGEKMDPWMLPFPDGQGAAGFYAGTEALKEYLGICLAEPLEKDSTYLIKFYIGFVSLSNSPGMELTFFGSPNCASFPTEYVDCPSDQAGWQELNSVYVSTVSRVPSWLEFEIELNPTSETRSLIIGAPCEFDGKFEGYYYIDNLRLREKRDFDFDLIEIDSRCSDGYVLRVAFVPNSSFQWYKEGIALVGETTSELNQMYGEGIYQLRITDRNSGICRISDDIEFKIPIYETNDFAIFCQGESLLFQDEVINKEGLYHFQLVSEEGCDSLVTLTVSEQDNDVDTVFARILPGTSFFHAFKKFTKEGEYEIDVLTDVGCIQRVVVILEHFDIFIPNVFSPNGDGNNDTFEPYLSDELVFRPEMVIYDRWGNILHEGGSWDGTYNHEYVGDGVYLYQLKLINLEGQESESYSGSITVMK